MVPQRRTSVYKAPSVIATATFLAVLAAAVLPYSYAADLCNDMTKKVREQVIDSLVWPKSALIALSGKLPDAWDPTVKGEVVPNGQFPSTAGVLEYFYALAGPLDPNPANNLDTGRVVNTEVIWMACNRTARTVATETFIQLADGRGNLTAKIDMIHVYKFNKAKRICGYSLTSKRQEIVLDSAPGSVDPAVIIPRVCGGLQFLCTGPNQQFANFTSCVNFMSSIPIGTSASLDQNNVICRQLHLNLAAIEPTTHCPHAGPTGGGKCVTKGVESLYKVKEFMACK